MTFETWWIYLVTVLIFMSTPGPSHLLMISVSMTNGFHRSLATAAGDLSANAIQITLAGLGLATVLVASKFSFSVIKWFGVTYLIWMGIRQIRSSFQKRSEVLKTKPASIKSLWAKGFITSAANPKAVIFFAALFPQFINQGEPIFFKSWCWVLHISSLTGYSLPATANVRIGWRPGLPTLAEHGLIDLQAQA